MATRRTLAAKTKGSSPFGGFMITTKDIGKRIAIKIQHTDGKKSWESGPSTGNDIRLAMSPDMTVNGQCIIKLNDMLLHADPKLIRIIDEC